MKHTIRKYIDPQEIFNRVSASLKSYADSDMILFDDYYKTLDWCNSLLGLKINPTKEAFVPITGNTAVLPDDFHLLELALVVGKEKITQKFGVKKTITLSGVCPTLKDLTLDKCCNFKLECGEKPVLTCETEELSIEFEETFIIRPSERKYCANDCLNLEPTHCRYMMEITENEIFFDSIVTGNLYLLYTAAMNAKGNIPVCLDHPIILEFYEQAVKYQILKDLFINKRLEIGQALQLVERDYIKAKNHAISLVSTPEVSEFTSVNNALKRSFRRKNYYIL